MSVIFDTLEYTKGAEKVGIKREHAEYQASQIIKLIDEKLVTKEDLKKLKNDIIIKLGGMIIISSGVIIGVLGLISKI